MKCLKNTKTGTIVRVSDQEASRLSGREWQYVPKLEWKVATRGQSESQVIESEKKERTLSKKAARRKQIKEKQRQD